MFYQFYKQPFENNLLAKQPFGKRLDQNPTDGGME
jgi:hypothetical protein